MIHFFVISVYAQRSFSYVLSSLLCVFSGLTFESYTLPIFQEEKYDCIYKVLTESGLQQLTCRLNHCRWSDMILQAYHCVMEKELGLKWREQHPGCAHAFPHDLKSLFFPRTRIPHLQNEGWSHLCMKQCLAQHCHFSTIGPCRHH